MRFGWGRAATAALVLGLAACGGGDDPAAMADRQAKAAAFFLSSNAKAEGVRTLPSGLQYKVVQSGPAGARKPDGNDLVRVDYEGTLTDGKVFDSSFERGMPAVFTPEAVIPGWREALRLMSVGDEWIVYVPPALGYGERGAPPDIPPNSVLVFRLKLLDVAETPGDALPAPSTMG